MATDTKTTIIYSERIAGDRGNYYWPVKFDRSRRYIGVTQFANDGKTVTDRVLLSPAQVTALRKFLR